VNQNSNAGDFDIKGVKWKKQMGYPEPHSPNSSSCLLPLFLAKLPVAAPPSPAQNPTKAHLGPRALHLHTNPSFPPSSGNGVLAASSSCLATRHPAELLSTSGLFQLGLSGRARGGDNWLAPLLGVMASTRGRGREVR
jgi:hypothetical protein